jgi:hypothetical protein
MQRIIYLIIVLTSFVHAKSLAQADVQRHAKGDGLITYQFGVGVNAMHELRVERFVHPKWSLVYSGAYSYRPVSYTSSEVRLPIGCSVGVGALTLGGCAGMGYGSLDFAGDLFLLSLMIPDGVAYHFMLDKYFDISPYVNFSGLTLRIEDSGSTRFFYAPSAGMRMIAYLGQHFVLTGEQSFRRNFSGQIESLLGVGVSLRF